VILLLPLTSENFGRKMYARTSSYPNLSYTALAPDNDYRNVYQRSEKKKKKKEFTSGILGNNAKNRVS